MGRIRLSLPRATEDFLKYAARKGGFRSAGAYLKALFEDEKRAVEDDDAHIDEKLLEGLKGKSVPVTKKTWENLRKKLERSIATRRASRRTNR